MSASHLTRTKDWLRLRVRSADERRLEALRTTFAGRLYRRGKAARISGGSLGTWGEAAHSLLSESEIALRRYDFDTAWACYLEATRMEMFAYDPEEIEAARTALRAEATHAFEAGLARWRGRAILRLLAAPDTAFAEQLAALVSDRGTRAAVGALLSPHRDDVTVDHVHALLAEAQLARPADTARALVRLAGERDAARRTTLYAAQSLRDEESVEETIRLARVRRQLLILGAVLVAAVVGLLYVATTVPVDLGAPATPGEGGAGWLYVALCGVLGAGVSAFRSVSSRITRLRVPRHLLSGALTAMRPVLGAIPAIALYLMLSTDLIGGIVRPTTAGLLALAFAAGFSERWIVRAVEPLRPPDGVGPERLEPDPIRGELPVRSSAGT
jgi:hypothetical protein